MVVDSLLAAEPEALPVWLAPPFPLPVPVWMATPAAVTL